MSSIAVGMQIATANLQDVFLSVAMDVRIMILMNVKLLSFLWRCKLKKLNSAVAQLRAHSIQMCNDTNIEDVANNFIAAKDLLIAIYKYNVEKRNLPANAEKK